MNLEFFIDIGRLKIHSRGYWAGRGAAEEHVHDEQLEAELVQFLKVEQAESLVDFGCGLGLYVQALRNQGFTATGYDGNPDTPKISKKIGKVLDLSKKFQLRKKFDWVMSLEVGEHIPHEYEETFVKNLDRHAKKGIIISWAVPGQKGLGHFNEQSNEYIRSLITNLGYTNDLEAEAKFREQASLSWFKDTIMVFRKVS